MQKLKSRVRASLTVARMKNTIPVCTYCLLSFFRSRTCAGLVGVTSAWIVTLISILSIAGPTALASESFTEIRFFKINKKEQQREMSFVRNRTERGCFSVSLKRKLHRAQVIGFKSCEIFTNEDCAADSRLSFTWDGRRAPKGVEKDVPQQTLTTGSRWLAHPGPHQVFRSWSCQ